MEKQLTTISKALAQLDTRCGEISDQQAAIEANIHSTFRKIHSILDARKTELIGQLHQITQRKLKDLAVQRDQLETTLARISSCLGFMRDSLKSNQAEMLMMKTNTSKQVKELTTTFPPDMLKPNREADMIFSTLGDISTACQRYGKVSATRSSKFKVTGKGMVTVGETSTAVLQAIDFKGQPCEEPVASPEIELVSELTGTRTRGSIERTGQSQYKISYQPTIKGRHQLYVKAEDHHIKGSPFTITAKSPIENLGTPVLTAGNMRKPCGMAFTRGKVLITEYEAHCVSLFSRSGEKLGFFLASNQQVGGPRRVAVDIKGNVLVTDYSTHCIKKFTADGKFLAAVGNRGSGTLQFQHPEGIAINPSNNKVYVTDNNHRVQVLNSDLTYSSTFGEHGSGNGCFRDPRDVACDSTGKVYVADFNNHCIQAFTAEGKFLHKFGKCGNGSGELIWPTGIAIDTSDMLYICDSGNCRISVFTSDGVHVMSFGSRGGEPGQFRNPYGIAVDNGGVVYVCDSSNHNVQIF